MVVVEVVVVVVGICFHPSTSWGLLQNVPPKFSPKNTLPETNVAPEPIHFQVLC